MGDGAVLNWCDPERVSWSRDRLNEGAARAGKRPEDVRLVEYIRICVDEDVDTAGMSYAKSMLGYAPGQEVPSERLRKFAYRAHFERMGFTDELASLDDMRRRGASADEVAAAASEELLTRVGYYGNASGAKAAFESLADGLDTAIVRVVAAQAWDWTLSEQSCAHARRAVNHCRQTAQTATERRCRPAPGVCLAAGSRRSG